MAFVRRFAQDIFEMADDGLAYVKEVEWPTIYSKDGKTASENPILRNGTRVQPVFQRT